MAFLRLKRLDHSDPITSCKLIFTPDKRNFQSGDVLQGILIVSLTAKRELNFHGFKVTMEGTALTKYNERRESTESRTDLFLDAHKYVYGREPPQHNSNHIGMAAGVHKFPFSFQIPNGVPGTFTSPFGTISYQIVAYIHMTGNRILRKTEKSFELRNRLILDESILQPIDFEQILGDNCQIKIILRIPQCGFLLGDDIPFGIELENPNTHEITSVSLTLVQKVIYHPGNPRRGTKTSTIISTIETKNMDGCYGAVWRWANALQIPPGVRTTYDKGIIQTHYSLRIEIVTAEIGTLSAEVPITIGSAFEGNQLDSPIAATCASARYTFSAVEPFTSPTPSTSTQSLRNNHGGLDSLSVDTPDDDGPSKEKPPSYSTLKSRSKSLEVLPPAYEDAVLHEDELLDNPDE